MDPPNTRNVQYIARSNRSRPPTQLHMSQNRNIDDWYSSHMKRPVHCAEARESPSNITKYCIAPVTKFWIQDLSEKSDNCFSFLFYSSLLFYTLLLSTPTILNSTVLFSTILYSTLFFPTLLYSTLLFSINLCCFLLFCALYSSLLYSVLLYSSLLYSALLFSTLLYSTLLFSSLLWSNLLYSYSFLLFPFFATLLTLLYSAILFQFYNSVSRKFLIQISFDNHCLLIFTSSILSIRYDLV